jgi:hypothetical protein
VVRGFYKLIGLLAAVTLEKIHGIYRYCVASNVVFIHGGLLTFSAVDAGAPLYTPNDSDVITPYLVVSACRIILDARVSVTVRHFSKELMGQRLI